MRWAMVLLAFCAGCGGLEASNNGIQGHWATVSDVASIQMDLFPGAENVSGTATLTYASDGHLGTYAVTTLPDERLHWKLVTGAHGDTQTNDFHVKIVPYCKGEPRPAPERLYQIDLDGLVFTRVSVRAPDCTAFGQPG